MGHWEALGGVLGGTGKHWDEDLCVLVVLGGTGVRLYVYWEVLGGTAGGSLGILVILVPVPPRSACTMLVSAYWHGLHPGYYLSFLSVPLWLAAERAAEKALGGLLAPGGPPLARGLQWFLKMRAYDYLCMGFVLLGARHTLRYWASVGFCLHLLPLLILAAAAVAGPRQKVAQK